jgi:8-oxo-dGTP diphosphatase
MSATTGPVETPPVEARDQPLIAVDVVPVSFTADGLRVASARRRFEPFEGRHALPGVLLGAGESLQTAAQRALATKAGIDAADTRHLFQIGAFDGSNRDPRQHAISIVFVAVIAPEPSIAPGPDTAWWSVEAIPALPFDHDAIVAEALAQLRTRLWHDDAVTRALTGSWFSTPDAVRLTDAITGTTTHQSNLRRALAAHPALVSRPAPDTGRPGRRPLVWEWAR